MNEVKYNKFSTADRAKKVFHYSDAMLKEHPLGALMNRFISYHLILRHYMGKLGVIANNDSPFVYRKLLNFQLSRCMLEMVRDSRYASDDGSRQTAPGASQATKNKQKFRRVCALALPLLALRDGLRSGTCDVTIIGPLQMYMG